MESSSNYDYVRLVACIHHTAGSYVAISPVIQGTSLLFGSRRCSDMASLSRLSLLETLALVNRKLSATQSVHSLICKHLLLAIVRLSLARYGTFALLRSSALAIHAQRIQLGVEVNYRCRIRDEKHQCRREDGESSDLGYRSVNTLSSLDQH